jgi:hypothetical protein
MKLMNKTTLWTSLLLASAIAITGCGSNDKTDAGSVVGAKNIVLSLDQYPVANIETGRGTHIARYAVHAVDASGKPQSRLPISVSLVNKVHPTGYSGAIHKTEPVTFTADNVNFAAMGVKPGDTLIIIPTTYGSEELSYVGDWKITEVSDKLTLGQNKVYNLASAGLLTYVVGDERSFDGYLAHVQRPDDSNQSSKVPDIEKGLTFFDIAFDKTLADSGRCVWVGVHLEGSRTGTARCVFPYAPEPVDPEDSNSTSGGSSCSGSSCSSTSSTCSSGGTCPNSTN